LQVLFAYIDRTGSGLLIAVPLVGMKIMLALTTLSLPFVISQTGGGLWIAHSSAGFNEVIPEIRTL
jgi:hypothetical protein